MSRVRCKQLRRPWWSGEREQRCSGPASSSSVSLRGEHRPTRTKGQKGGTMNQFHTEREQRFLDLAATLADEFAQRAAQHDEEESFPYENYARLRESGYTLLTIPEELGGLGASMLQRIKAQERLAQGCARPRWLSTCISMSSG